MFNFFGISGRVPPEAATHLAPVVGVRASARVRALSHSGLPVDGEDHVSVQSMTGGSDAAGSVLGAYAQHQRDLTSERQPLARVEQVMSAPVFSLPARLPLIDAWRALRAQGFAQAPVVAGDANQTLIGLLWTADLMQPAAWPDALDDASHWQTHHQAFWQRPVQAAMRTPVPAVTPQADLRRVAAALLQLKLPGLPVTDEQGQLLGFVARSDLLQAMVADPPLDLWG